jgi:2-oxoglutarate/2-oxoacid ferredoxin oxidoreductase subunit beta
MPSITKPQISTPHLRPNAIGLTRLDYEGAMSTLCAGCGHDSVTAAIVQALYELAVPPHRIAKLSGIGCSSKTPTYFVRQAHGFNSVHGRMPSVATGASAANRELLLVGVSGDGDSLSIGLGQLCHAIRRNVDMLYVLENNGVYGLTKGQFSASADVGSRSKRGEANMQQPIDPVLLALEMGASFVARSFSGNKPELVPLLKAGLAHRGFALIDVISPCVTFNDHEGSTKSYGYTRAHLSDVAAIDFVPLRREIRAEYPPDGSMDVRLHDGSIARFRHVRPGYDPTDREAAAAYVRRLQRAGEIATGLLFVEGGGAELHAANATIAAPLATLPHETLCPGAAALDALQRDWR